MLGYYIRLAFKSFRRTPGLTALMIGAVAFGIAACIVTLTVHHTMGRDPIWRKNNVLYAMTMDSWDPHRPYDSAHPTLPPDMLTCRDATHLEGSGIPTRTALLSFVQGALAGAPGQRVPIWATTPTTTSGFFHIWTHRVRNHRRTTAAAQWTRSQRHRDERSA